MKLIINVTFTAGHYHGAEWPPSPARLFQALVAGSHRGAFGQHEPDRRDAALRWLERQSPPLIYAPNLELNNGHIIEYVPNNDNNAPRKGHVRAEKSMLRYSMAGPTSIAYSFPVAAGDIGLAGDIAAMSSLITYLGRTVDSTYALGNVAPSDPPNLAGDRLIWHHHNTRSGPWLVPASGFLDFLNQRYPRSVSESQPDFSNSGSCSYSTQSYVGNVPLAYFTVHELDGIKTKAFPPWAVRLVSGLVRGAMVEWANRLSTKQAFDADRMAQLIHGHQNAAASAPVKGPHIAVLPLPTQTQSFKADGWLRKVAVVGFGCLTSQDREMFDALVGTLNGSVLKDLGEAKYLLRIVPAPVADPMGILSDQCAKAWRSITPVVLPSLPRKGRKLEAGLLRALILQGYKPDQIESLAAYTGPIVPKTLSANEYNLGKGSYLARFPRCHSEIRFTQPISGPFILGSGRYVGLGLFVPTE